MRSAWEAVIAELGAAGLERPGAAEDLRVRDVLAIFNGWDRWNLVQLRCAFTGETPTDWAVIYEDEPTFDPSCLNRIVFVKPTDGFKRVLNAIQRFAPLVSCVEG